MTQQAHCVAFRFRVQADADEGETRSTSAASEQVSTSGDGEDKRRAGGNRRLPLSFGMEAHSCDESRLRVSSDLGQPV